MNRRALLAAALALSACKVEPLFEDVPSFAADVVLVKDRSISSGAMLANLVMSPPDRVELPPEALVPLPGGNESPGPDTDFNLELDVRYAATGVQGGRQAGDFVPYLVVEVSIENLDSGAVLETFLTPHISLTKGLHYGRSIALTKDLGISEAGYSVAVSIVPPALSTDPAFTENPRGRSALSPGITISEEIVPFLQGTVFSIRPASAREPDVIKFSSAFTLNDFLKVNEDTAGGTGGATGYTY